MEKGGWVYIMTNRPGGVLYVGVTNNLARRCHEHTTGQGGTFTNKYHCCTLVWYEGFPEITDAIAREKQIKAGARKDKLHLIQSMNPSWKDLQTTLNS
jgi:putative endonuclease